MDSSNYKLYHEHHDFNSRSFLDNYFLDSPQTTFTDDNMVFPIENLKKIFAEGHIKGDVLIDLSMSSMVYHLYSACEFFKDIIVLKASNRCIMELKRWVDKRTGAFYWGHATELHEGNSDLSQDKEEKMRSAIQHVVKCDYTKENITDPIVLPLADCIISAWLLDVISRNQDDYITYLRRFKKLLKSGGHLILIGILEQTTYSAGNEKYHCFTYNEDFAKKALIAEDFVIDYCKIKKRTAESDLADYKSMLFLVSHKK